MAAAATRQHRQLEQDFDGSKRRHQRLDLESSDVSRGGSKGGGGMSRGGSGASSGSGGVSRGSGDTSNGSGGASRGSGDASSGSGSASWGGSGWLSWGGGWLSWGTPPLSLLSLFVLGFRVAASLLGQLKWTYWTLDLMLG
jgi:hypothetical protein